MANTNIATVTVEHGNVYIRWSTPIAQYTDHLVDRDYASHRIDALIEVEPDRKQEDKNGKGRKQCDHLWIKPLAKRAATHHSDIGEEGQRPGDHEDDTRPFDGRTIEIAK